MPGKKMKCPILTFQPSLYRSFDRHVKVITVSKKTNAVKPLTRSVLNLPVNTPVSENQYSRRASQAQGSSQTIKNKRPLSKLPSNLKEAPVGPASLPDYSNYIGRKFTEKEKSSVKVFQLEQHCKNLEDELDQVKFEIVKIVSDKNDFSKENAVLRTYQNAFATLTEQNESMKKKLEELAIMDSSNEPLRMIPESERSSPDGQEKDSDQVLIYKSTSDYEEEVIQFKDTLDKLEKEKQNLKEKFDSERKDYADRNK